jgi:putative transposase
MNELKNRGLNDVFDAVVDGLKGFPEAIATVFPLTTVQTRVIHPIRNSPAFVSWKDRKLIMPDLKATYRAATAETATAEPRRLSPMGQALPGSARRGDEPGTMSCRWFAFPPAIRKVIYTANAVESLHRSLRKIINTCGISQPTKRR